MGCATLTWALRGQARAGRHDCALSPRGEGSMQCFAHADRVREARADVQAPSPIRLCEILSSLSARERAQYRRLVACAYERMDRVSALSILAVFWRARPPIALANSLDVRAMLSTADDLDLCLSSPLAERAAEYPTQTDG